MSRTKHMSYTYQQYNAAQCNTLEMRKIMTGVASSHDLTQAKQEKPVVLYLKVGKFTLLQLKFCFMFAQ